MKYIYPYKVYIFAFVIYLIFCSYGFFNLFIMGEFSVILSAIYIASCFCISFFYYMWYRIYKNIYYVVKKNSISVVKNKVETVYEEYQIKKIDFINKNGFFKLNGGIVIELFDGDKLYITNELYLLNKFKIELLFNFREKCISQY